VVVKKKILNILLNVQNYNLILQKKEIEEEDSGINYHCNYFPQWYQILPPKILLYPDIINSLFRCSRTNSKFSTVTLATFSLKEQFLLQENG